MFEPLPPTIQRKRESHFIVLDPARGIAVLMVVAFHLNYGETVQSAVPIIHAIARHGYLGVQLFFVISGYCLAAAAISTLRRDKGVGDFLRRRFRRIYPPFWCSIIFLASLPWLKYAVYWLAGMDAATPKPLYLSLDGWDWAGIATLLQGFRYGNVPLHEKFDAFNVVYWTLVIEIQFYLVVAFSIYKPKFYYPILIFTTVCGCAALLAKSYGFWDVNTGIFLPHWPLFAAGILLFEFRTRDQSLLRWMRPNLAVILAATAISILLLGFVAQLKDGRVVRPVDFGTGAAVILWLLIPIQDRLQSSSKQAAQMVKGLAYPLCWFGTISYSIYLVHFNLYKPIILVVSRAIDTDSVGFQLCLPIIICVACYPFYYFCERPFLNTSSSACEIHNPNRQANAP